MFNAWLVVALLVPVALLNYLDRQMLAAMKSSIQAEIPGVANDDSWGMVLALFKWTYAVLSPFGGYIADRYGKRWTICASLFVWSAVTYWTGQVQSYNELLWARALMGISEACYIPAALALIADYHQGSTRSRAISCHQMGIYSGVIIGSFSGYVADSPDLGWRWAFTVCGIIGMIYAVPLLSFIRDQKVPESAENTTSNRSLPSTIRELFSNRGFLMLLMYFTLPAIAGWVVRDWMPTILKQEFKIAQGPAGVAATLSYQIPAIFSALFAGWLADRWMQKTERGRIHVSAIGMAILIPAIFGVGLAGTLTIAILCLIMFGISWGFFDSMNMPILTQLVRPELRATGYGMMNLFSITCGGFADWGFGLLRKAEVPLYIIFGLISAAAICSLLIVIFIPVQKPTSAESSSS
jgi:MFS family permease